MLNQQSLEDCLLELHRFEIDNGVKLCAVPKVLLIHPKLYYSARRILQSWRKARKTIYLKRRGK